MQSRDGDDGGDDTGFNTASNASTSSLSGLAGRGQSGSSTPARGTRTPRFDLTSLTMTREPETYARRGHDEDDDDDDNRFPEGVNDDSARWSEDPDDYSPPASTTPTWEESYFTLKRNLSYKSLKEIELKHVQKQLWRKQGEPRKRPRDLEQLILYASTGATRAFLIGYALRSGVSVVTTFIRCIQRRKFKTALILHAMFGEEAFRFGGLFGTFVFLWKMALHSLRLFNPGRKGKGRTEFWHAPMAGALSGLAILAEKKRNRAGIAQQLLVRGLQGWYNILHKRGHVRIPHGAVLLFGAACGQIMYAWLVSPDSLNPGYYQWILRASKVPGPILPWVVARHKRTDEPPPLEEAYKILTRHDVSPLNALKIESIIDGVEKGDYGVAFPPCEMVHPWEDSCLWTSVLRWRDVFAWIAPVYTALHFIPPVLFKRKSFMQNPLSVIHKALKGTVRSSGFLATFVVIFQSLVCFRHQTWWFGKTLPDPLRALWLTKYYYWALGFSTCLSLFIEEKKRRGELAMYVMPKALESAWSIARRRAYVPFIPGGEVLLSSAAMSMVMSTYQHEPTMLSGLVRTIVYQFVGLD